MAKRCGSLICLVAGAGLALAAGAAVAGFEAAAAILAVALAMTVALARVSPEAGPMQRPIVELARCRRYGLTGHVMVASLSTRVRPGERRKLVEQLTRSIRITDGVAAIEGRHPGPLLCTVFSDQGVETGSIERRLRSLCPGLDFGWAVFPADGVTLDELLKAAVARSAPPAPAPRPAVPLTPRTTLGMHASSASSLRKEG